MRQPRARAAGLIITLAALALAGCGTSSGAAAGNPATAAPASTSAPAEQPALPAGGAWTTPQYPSATAAAHAAGCDIVADGGSGAGGVHCTMPDPAVAALGEISIAVFTTPDVEQRAADDARALADQSGDVYIVQGKGWMAECIDLGNACRAVQAKIGGDLAHYTQWNN